MDVAELQDQLAAHLREPGREAGVSIHDSFEFLESLTTDRALIERALTTEKTRFQIGMDRHVRLTRPARTLGRQPR